MYEEQNKYNTTLIYLPVNDSTSCTQQVLQQRWKRDLIHVYQRLIRKAWIERILLISSRFYENMTHVSESGDAI